MKKGTKHTFPTSVAWQHSMRNVFWTNCLDDERPTTTIILILFPKLMVTPATLSRVEGNNLCNLKFRVSKSVSFSRKKFIFFTHLPRLKNFQLH